MEGDEEEVDDDDLKLGRSRKKTGGGGGRGGTVLFRTLASLSFYPLNPNVQEMKFFHLKCRLVDRNKK